jgi:hypothetical protein
MRLDELLTNSQTTSAQLADFFDGLDHAGRMDALNTTSKAHQARMWEIAADAPPITLDHFVPASVADRSAVVHHGRNTLPVFRSFQKCFARPTDGTSRLFGYNEGMTRPLIGPGYFVAHSTEGNADWTKRGAIVVNYFKVPDHEVPEGWPAIKPNSSGLQVLVYNKTRDFMRAVSQNVSIGMAFKVEKSMNSWFTLNRED